MLRHVPVTILDPLRHPALFGRLRPFRDLTSWRNWLVALKAVYGLPLGEEELTTFRQLSGGSGGID